MFLNRREAGKRLGSELSDYKNEKPIVVAIPRGGVEIGFWVAEILDCEMTIAVSRKLGFLNHSEVAFGALTEDGSLYLNPRVKGRLSKEEIETVLKREQKEIERRIRIYRMGKPFPDLKNRTVILVDDGIATGSTLLATVDMCKKKNPKKLIIAAPVSGRVMIETLISRADDVVILEIPDDYYAVSQVYREFLPGSDEEVEKLMRLAKIRIRLIESLKQLVEFRQKLTK